MGLMHDLGLGLLRFLASRQSPPSASQTISIVMRFVGQSQTAEALSLMEAHATLTSEVYENPSLLVERLRDRLAGNDAASAIQFSLILSWLLGLEGRHDDSRSVLEASLGLEIEDMADPARLMECIRKKLEGVPPDLAAIAIVGYANLFCMTGRFAEGLALLESDLGLLPGVGEEDFCTAICRRLGLLSTEVALLYASGLSDVLGLAGREEEAAWVFKSAAGLAVGPQDLVPSVRSFLASVSANTAASFLFHFTGVLNSEELGATRLALLEGHLDLRSEDYRDREHLAAKLEARLAGVLPGTASSLKRCLADSLEDQDRIQDALMVFRADTGLVEDMKEKAAGIGADLRARLEAEIPKDMALLYVAHIASTLTSADKTEQAVTLLEGYAGVHPDDYADLGAMVNCLKRLLEEWRESAAATGIASLLFGLQELDEKEKADLLAEAFVAASCSLKDRRGGDHFSLAPLLAIYEAWLERFRHEPEQQPLDVCRDLVAYLRQNFATHGVQLKDRSELLKVSGNLRRRIVETGLFWADQESDPEKASRVAAEVQFWDAELSQRLLAERFLLEPIRPVPPGVPPTRAWPWRDIERPQSANYLPDPLLMRLDGGCLDDKGGGLRSPSEPTSEIPTRLQRERTSLLQKAREVIVRGVDEEKMAEVLGESGLLLRGSFGDGGRFLWFALQSDGRRIRTVGKGRGSLGDLERLRWAAARHDFRMVLARFRAGVRMPGTVITVLREVRQAFDELLFELGPPTSPGYLERRLKWVSSRFVSPWFWDVPRLLLPVLGALQAAPEWGEEFDDWARDTAAHLREMRDRLSQTAPTRLQEELDRITADYIEEARRILMLDGLTPALSLESDLIVQFDDALHTVPIAHLPVGGEPLFRRVRSIRSSITLLMTSLQVETEREVEKAAAEPGRLLSVSHFKPYDSALSGAVWLHHGFSILADRYGLEAFAAADQPAGSVGLLRTSLEDLRHFRALAICGHGSIHDSGITLKQDENDFGRLWKGDGCDLSGVEWLWMVSCSIGRLKQSGDLDVEGFCVQLALHRARSVAAFRWPVHSVEAVSLVNESIHHYLEALKSGKEANVRCLRARALNDARKRFFGDGLNSPIYPHVGLNTAAACELFGLG